jgi:hypothetical protein
MLDKCSEIVACALLSLWHSVAERGYAMLSYRESVRPSVSEDASERRFIFLSMFWNISLISALVVSWISDPEVARQSAAVSASKQDEGEALTCEPE